VQKEMGSYAMSSRARLKQSYGSDKKQAAVKALERGENLTKVSHQFQVIKHTFMILVLLKMLFSRKCISSPFRYMFRMSPKIMCAHFHVLSDIYYSWSFCYMTAYKLLSCKNYMK
jgi:hypothetical protein